MKDCGPIDEDVLSVLDNCLDQLEAVNDVIFQIAETTDKIEDEDCIELLTEVIGVLMHIGDMCTMGRLELMSLLKESTKNTLQKNLSRKAAEDLR